MAGTDGIGETGIEKRSGKMFNASGKEAQHRRSFDDCVPGHGPILALHRRGSEADCDVRFHPAMTGRIPENHRATAWVKDDPFGVEFAEIDVAAGRMTASGVAIGTAPLPYRLDYELETGAGFVTSRLRATSRGEGWRRELDLRRGADGVWSVAGHQAGHLDLPPAGGDAEGLAGALDCDLGLSPVTNMMPILRHRLLDGGGPVEFTMAWVAVPELAVQPDGQRYRHIGSAAGHHVIRFEATDGSFAADITVDADAVVVDYPTIARRLSDHERPPLSGDR